MAQAGGCRSSLRVKEANQAEEGGSRQPEHVLAGGAVTGVCIAEKGAYDFHRALGLWLQALSRQTPGLPG